MNTEITTTSEPTATRLLGNEIARELISEYELANLLEKNIRTLRRWDVQRIGPPRIKIGRSVYYKRSSVLSWIEGNERRLREPRMRKAT